MHACLLLEGRTASIAEESRGSSVDYAEESRLGRGVPIQAAQNTKSGQVKVSSSRRNVW